MWCVREYVCELPSLENFQVACDGENIANSPCGFEAFFHSENTGSGDREEGERRKRETMLSGLPVCLRICATLVAVKCMCVCVACVVCSESRCECVCTARVRESFDCGRQGAVMCVKNVHIR